MDLVIWTYIFGGATIFALIVGIFSVWNGRRTRRDLRQLIEEIDRRTREVIQEGDKNTQEIIERGDQRTHQLLERMNGRMEQLAQYMHDTDQHMQEMDRRHTELLSDLLRRAS